LKPNKTFLPVGPITLTRLVRSRSRLHQQPPATASTSDEAPKVDAEGTPFNADMHTGTLTKAGLWRMKVGVSRPPAAAKPALDL
jgi:hypothetical protein